MKAILEFNLDDPAERNAHRRAISATDAYLVMHDLDNELRSLAKYTNQYVISIADVRQMLVKSQEKYHINMNDLE